MRAERRNRSNRLFDFGLVVLSVAVALGLTLLLKPWLYPTVTPLFFVAVMISAWLGGWETGLLATVLSTLAVNYFFIEPLYSLQIINIGTVVRLSLFAIASGLVSWLTRSQRMALERLRANYQTLKETMAREEAAQARGSQAKEALRQSEARLRAVAANLPQGAVFVVDRNLRYLLAEGKALEDVGMTSENLVGKTIWEALDPDLAAIYEPYFRQALNGEPFSHEYSSHARHYISHGTPLVNDRGEVYAVLAMSYDITERKCVEERLRESEEKFRTFANTIPVLMWQQDAEGKNVWVNQYFIDFAGKTAEEISGEGWEKLFHLDDAEKFVAGFMEAIRTRQPWQGRVRARRHDSEWRWVESFAQPLFGSDGAYLGHVGVTPDVTATVEAEAALRENMDELTRFNRVVVGRELRMIELKKEVNELLARQGSERRYPLEFESSAEGNSK